MELARSLRLTALTLFLTLPVSAARAQLPTQRPTVEQARALLATRPDLVAMLRQRIRTSGMTATQIRARLRAEGYPEDLLDSYLPGRDDSAVADPTEDVYSAVRTLGIADSIEVSEMRENSSSAPIQQEGLRGNAARLDSPRHRRGAGAARSDTPVDSLRIFGSDIFAASTSRFDPNLNGPVDSNYRLGPGDRLVLVLTGDVEASYSLDVTRQGFIVVPRVGQIEVANLTLGQLEDVLYTRLGQVYSGVQRGGGSTRFSISPARLRSNQVYVIGDVVEPGSYRISAAGTVLTALYAAGGPTDVGSMRNIVVRRSGKVVDQLDVYEYLLRGDATHDPRLENGDVVFVPVHGPRVTVTGEVLRPAHYELKPDDGLADVIRAAGGFKATANRRRVQIERIVPASSGSRPGRDRIVIDLDSDRLDDALEVGVPLEDGDVIRVFPITDRVRNRVYILGNVWNPGQVGFSTGMKLSDALKLAGGLKPDVYLGEVLVSRLRPDSTRIQLRTSLLDSLGAVRDDFPLSDDDEIRVFSVTEFRPDRYVAINGAIRKPGRYPYRQGMTLRDLVLLAGGVQERAYLQEAEIARLPESRENGGLATTLRFPLDSTYLFEHYASGKGPRPFETPIQSSAASEVPLAPYDNVLILEQPDWEFQRTVVVTGEVRFPGVYSLKSRGERLSDILHRAGGLTSEGHADGVYFSRKRGGVGRIGIDLPRVLANPRFRDNLILQDGDSINVPAFNAVVTVGGSVNSPVAVSYVPGMDLDYYIRAAGGLNTKADGKRAYVTQPNGKVDSRKVRRFLPDAVPRPRPGSVVLVPAKDSEQRRDNVQLVVGLAQILASLAALTAVIINSRN